MALVKKDKVWHLYLRNQYKYRNGFISIPFTKQLRFVYHWKGIGHSLQSIQKVLNIYVDLHSSFSFFRSWSCRLNSEHYDQKHNKIDCAMLFVSRNFRTSASNPKEGVTRSGRHPRSRIHYWYGECYTRDWLRPRSSEVCCLRTRFTTSNKRRENIHI